MKPYYEHAGITIYHGDCREVLPQLAEFEVVVTDPPYGIGLSNHAAGRERRAESYKISGDDSGDVGQFLVDYCERFGLPLVLFASPFRPWVGEWRNLLAWNKGGAVGGGGDTAVCMKRTWELIQTARTRLHGPRDGSVLDYWMTPDDSALHVARKPPELMAYLLSKFTGHDDRIIDPCAGSGSTLEAAKKLGMRAIGIEIEERFCELSAKRLSQEVLQF